MYQEFCYQKLFWHFTVWINCSSDLKKFANSIIKTFFLPIDQNNFGNKIPFLCQRYPFIRISSYVLHITLLNWLSIYFQVAHEYWHNSMFPKSRPKSPLQKYDLYTYWKIILKIENICTLFTSVFYYVFAFGINGHITWLKFRGPKGSTNQSYSSCFQFKVVCILRSIHFYNSVCTIFNFSKQVKYFSWNLSFICSFRYLVLINWRLCTTLF